MMTEAKVRTYNVCMHGDADAIVCADAIPAYLLHLLKMQKRFCDATKGKLCVN